MDYKIQKYLNFILLRDNSLTNFLLVKVIILAEVDI